MSKRQDKLRENIGRMIRFDRPNGNKLIYFIISDLVKDGRQICYTLRSMGLEHDGGDYQINISTMDVLEKNGRYEFC